MFLKMRQSHHQDPMPPHQKLGGRNRSGITAFASSRPALQSYQTSRGPVLCLLQNRALCTVPCRRLFCGRCSSAASSTVRLRSCRCSSRPRSSSRRRSRSCSTRRCHSWSLLRRRSASASLFSSGAATLVDGDDILGISPREGERYDCTT